MDEQTHDGRAGARDAVAPWQASLAALEIWLDREADAVWPRDDGRAQADDLLAMLRDSLDALARGTDPLSDQAQPPAAVDPRSIDQLLAGANRPRPAPSRWWPEQRRRGLLNLALWQALEHLRAGPHPPPLRRLHAWLAQPAPPCIGISPSTAFAAGDGARRFFDESVRATLDMLVRRFDPAYAGAIPARAFDGSLPSLVAWTHAWSVAVAGTFLEQLTSHLGDDVAQAQRNLWAGRLDAVRPRTRSGLTVLPAHAAMSFDLWTGALEAQVIAFDAARWRAHAAGTRRHCVPIDMHKYAAQRGHSVAPLYRCVFVDRLLDVLGRSGEAHDVAAAMAPHTIAIDVERPHDGHVQNLHLLVRWHDRLQPPGTPVRRGGRGGDDHAPGGGGASSPDTRLRFVVGSSDGRFGAVDVERWHARLDEAALAQELAAARLTWRAASADTGAEVGGPPSSLRSLPPEGAVSGFAWPVLSLSKGPGATGGLVSIGACDCWSAVDADAQWINPMLVLCVDDAWYELPVELDDREDASTEWLVRADIPLPSGLSLVELRRAAASADAVCCVAHAVGLGAFITVAIDVDAWRRA